MSAMQGESWLLERIKLFGADVYAGDFPTLRDRIGHTIVEHGIATVIAGRGPDGKAETFSQAFTRIYAVKLKDVPRVTEQSPRRDRISSGATEPRRR